MSPKLFAWSDTYCVGIPIMDDQRKLILEIINDLAVAAECGQAPSDIACHLSRLSNCCSQHFKAEEKLFDCWDFPEKQAHIAAHDTFRQALKHLIAQRRKSANEEELVDLADFVGQWLTNHALKMDKRFAKVFHAYQGQ